MRYFISALDNNALRLILLQVNPGVHWMVRERGAQPDALVNDLAVCHCYNVTSFSPLDGRYSYKKAQTYTFNLRI